MSSRPSRLKSPRATAAIPDPGAWVASSAGANVPSPRPGRTAIVPDDAAEVVSREVRAACGERAVGVAQADQDLHAADDEREILSAVSVEIGGDEVGDPV